MSNRTPMTRSRKSLAAGLLTAAAAVAVLTACDDGDSGDAPMSGQMSPTSEMMAPSDTMAPSMSTAPSMEPSMDPSMGPSMSPAPMSPEDGMDN